MIRSCVPCLVLAKYIKMLKWQKLPWGIWSTAGDYGLLPTINAASKDTKRVTRIRKLKERPGIKTTPCWRWIEVGQRVHRFVVYNKSFPDIEMILFKIVRSNPLASLCWFCQRGISFCPVWILLWRLFGNIKCIHSETPEGTDLQMVKNLKVVGLKERRIQGTVQTRHTPSMVLIFTTLDTGKQMTYLWSDQQPLWLEHLRWISWCEI